jgi:hypothetical protein
MNWTIRLRRWHAYIGVFIAPSVLFFAVTGALQIFNLHEAHGSYRPAVVLEKLSAVHKDQVFEEPHDHPPSGAEPPPGPAAAADHHAAGDDDDRLSVPTLVLKWFFFFVAVALSVSTLIGVWMGATQLRSGALVWTLLVTGALIPIVIASL